ncbi:MAG: type II secretion system protein [Lachnospiraceae bacterium]|nr:type II secretion system protein [Lachnospiraceae bacterium]
MKRRKMNNKGFTLVELIVVLVILAILAAILVPTLMGYIDRAKKEKDFSTAQTVRVAYQSALAEAYAKWDGNGNLEDKVEASSVWRLVGATGSNNNYTLDGVPVSYDAVTLDKTNNSYQILKMHVTINGNNYYLMNNTWSADKPSGFDGTNGG